MRSFDLASDARIVQFSHTVRHDFTLMLLTHLH